MKAAVPTIHYLQTKDKCQRSTVLLHHNYTRIILLEARHISSGLTNHIHNINCSDSELKFYSTTIVIAVLKVETFNLIFHMTRNYVFA